MNIILYQKILKILILHKYEFENIQKYYVNWFYSIIGKTSTFELELIKFLLILYPYNLLTNK